MDFSYSDRVQQLRRQLMDFMDSYVMPRVGEWKQEVEAGQYPVSFMDDLKALAREEGLWNLFLPSLGDDEPGTRLSNLEYAPSGGDHGSACPGPQRCSTAMRRTRATWKCCTCSAARRRSGNGWSRC
jgi:alkylation response protein AidB-like acyl-CoA dehydrogenase